MSELKYSKEQIIDACKEAGLGILECNSLITVLGCCQPEATKPAPKFVTCPKCKGNHAGIGIDGVETDCSYCENGMVQAIQQPKEERTAFEAWAGVEYRNSSHYTQFDMEYGWDAWQARAALASPADALVAGDSELLNWLEDKCATLGLKFDASGYILAIGKQAVSTGVTARAAIRAAIQAQKDGHG